MNRTSVVPIRRRERGQALAYVGIAMLTLMAFAVIGVDVGRLAFTAAEVQSVADTAAVAAMGYAADLQNSPGSGINPVTEARKIIAKNYVDGGSAIGATTGDDVIQVLEPGTYDWATGAFTAGGTWLDATAAHAQGTKTVDNFLAGVMHPAFSTSGVRRDAIASISGQCSNRNLMPIAIGDCYFDAFKNSETCSDLPTLVQVPDGVDNSCWTSLGPASANASTVSNYFPCGGGAGNTTPVVTQGQNINVINGQATSVMQTIRACYDAGFKEWDVPLVECGKCNQAMKVTGFAHIVITDVQDTSSPKYIQLKSTCKVETGNGGGCNNIGGLTGVSLVK